MIILQLIGLLFNVYLIMLFIRILGSWIPELQGTKFMQFISFYTDPYLNLFRRFIPPMGMLDLSPIAAFICLSILEVVVTYLIRLIFKI